MGIAGILVGLCIPMSAIILIYQASKAYSLKKLILVVCLKISYLVLFISLASSDIYNHYQVKVFYYMDWVPGRTIQHNGRIASFIYYNRIEKISRSKLANHTLSKVNISDTLYPNKPT